MRYSINILNANEKNGEILLQRLNHLTSSVLKISEGALHIKLLGTSSKRGRKSIELNEALSIKLVGIKDQSTALLVECDQFKNTLRSFQLDAFQSDFFDHTPISILMSCFKTALSSSTEPEVFLDKQLIREMKKFSDVFQSEGERVIFMNEGTVEDLELTKNDIKQIQTLEEEILPDQKVVISGRLEELKYSNYRVKVNTDQGIIHGYLSKGMDKTEIGRQWGNDISVAGIMHYGPGNTRNLEIIRIVESEQPDEFFEFKGQMELIKASPKKNPLKKWQGHFKGDDDFENLLGEI